MKVKLTRIRHPLACFQGEILANDDRTAHAEEIKLAFDYFPTLDSQVESSLTSVIENGNGTHIQVNKNNSSNGNLSHKSIPRRFVKFESNS